MQASGICTACNLQFVYNAPPSHSPRKFCGRKCANSRGVRKKSVAVDAAALNKAYWQENLTLREMASRFRIPYTSLRRLFAQHDIATHHIGTRKRFYAERALPTVIYPYALSPTDPGAELVLLVHRTVPSTIPEDYRADVCQDLLLALLTGATDSNGLGELCRPLVRRYSPKSHIVPLDTVDRNLT